jgi:hypothetical protein
VDEVGEAEAGEVVEAPPAGDGAVVAEGEDAAAAEADEGGEADPK